MKIKSVHTIMSQKLKEISHILKDSSGLDTEARQAITTLNEAYFRDNIDAFNECLGQVKRLYARPQGSLFCEQ